MTMFATPFPASQNWGLCADKAEIWSDMKGVSWQGIAEVCLIWKEKTMSYSALQHVRLSERRTN